MTAITSSTTCVRASTGRGCRAQPHADAHAQPLAADPSLARFRSAWNRSSASCCARRWLQRYVVASHERAFRALLPSCRTIRRVTIVGGGLFPRTALVLQKVLPAASLTIVDASAGNIEIARTFLALDAIELRTGTVLTGASAVTSNRLTRRDLVVIPLAFIGDRDRLYREPPAPAMLIHDWIWRRRTEGVTVSWLLLKRLNLVTR